MSESKREREKEGGGGRERKCVCEKGKDGERLFFFNCVSTLIKFLFVFPAVSACISSNNITSLHVHRNYRAS